MQANDHDIADITVGVEVVVEVDDFAAGEFEIVGDFKESEIFLRNKAVAQQVFAEIFFKCFPEVSTRGVDQDEWNDFRFACLHQGKGFEGLIHCSKAAWEKGDRIGVFHEVEFSREEVFEGEKFAVAPDRFVRFLLKGEFDVEGESVLAACSGLSGAHDSFASAGNDHVARFLHEFAKTEGGFVGGAGGLGTGGSENRYFFDPAIGCEDFVRITNFTHDPFKLLDVP